MRANAVLTSGGLSFVRDWLAGQNPTLPSYLAVGSGSLTVSPFVNALPGETYRAPIAMADAGGTTVTYHARFEQSVNWNQIVGCYGLIAGSATDQLGTGTLIAVGNESIPWTKNTTNVLAVDLSVAISGSMNAGATMTSGGLALLRDALAGTPVLPPSYIAVGSGGLFGFFDTQVPTEIFRTSIIQSVPVGQSVEFRGVIRPDECMGGYVNSYGVIAGNASSAFGSGMAVAIMSPPAPWTKVGEMRILIAGINLSGAVA